MICYISKKSKNLFTQLHENMNKELKDLSDSFEGGGRILNENPFFLEERARIAAFYEEEKKSLAKYRQFIVIEEMEEYKNFDGESVIIGCSVDVLFNGHPISYKILGTKEGNMDENILSCEAPISIAILGKKVGDTIPFRDDELKIISVCL